jgi:uncharacterized protein (TIGR03435 family)
VKVFQIAGPAWLDTERFDISAMVAPSSTKEQVRVMLQNLLAERFKLEVHREEREQPMFSLTVAKGGPKMKESDPVEAPKLDFSQPAPPPPPGPPKMGPDGFPVLPESLQGRAALFTMMMGNRSRGIAHQQTMKSLADWLTDQMSRPVADNTGLTAKYDFTVTFSTDGLAPTGPLGPMPAGPPMAGGRGPEPGPGLASEEPLPSVFAAVQEQLGLKLEPKRGPVETIVVDHMEKIPTAN